MIIKLVLLHGFVPNNLETGHKNGFIEFAISLVKQLLGSYKAETGHSQPSKYLVLKASPNYLGQILYRKLDFSSI